MALRTPVKGVFLRFTPRLGKNDAFSGTLPWASLYILRQWVVFFFGDFGGGRSSVSFAPAWRTSQIPFISAFRPFLGGAILNGPLAAAVESAIVGYTTTTLPRGFFALAVPFSSLETDTEGYPIAQLSGNLSANDSVTRADYLLVQDPDTKAYTTYYYKAQGWTKEGEETVTTDLIAPGQGVFLYKNRSAGTVLAAGRVVTAKTMSVTLKKGLNLVANPYPVSIAINALSGDLYANDSLNRADTIQRLNPETKAYTTYVLKPTGWHKVGANGAMEATPTTDAISADECFVFNKKRSEGALLFTSPIQ